MRKTVDEILSLLPILLVVFLIAYMGTNGLSWPGVTLILILIAWKLGAEWFAINRVRTLQAGDFDRISRLEKRLADINQLLRMDGRQL